MTLNEQQRTFVDWLNCLMEAIRQLHAVLEQEQDILLEHKLESLQLLAEHKNTLVEQIDALLAQLPNSSEAKEALVDKLIGALNLTKHRGGELWQETKDLMADCRALNETNGATISLLQEHNGQALALLFGQRCDRVCYGPDGQNQTGAGDRLLAST